MKDYLYYKQNNKESYDSDDTNITNIKPKERILLNCIQCRGTYSDAYSCKEYSCPLYEAKAKWMKRPHTCSEWFLEHRKNPNRITNIFN